MTPGTLRALEFDRIVDAVCSLALTPPGAARLAALAPATDPARVAAALAQTSEAVRFLADHAGLPLRAPADLDATITALAVENRALEPRQLTGLADFLESVEQCAHNVRRAPREAFPLLVGIAAGVASFDREIGDIRRAIDPTGEVFDHASPELRSIRDRLRRQRTRLRGTLESYLRGRDTAKYLQDQVVTDRNGRYVLLVRTEHRTAIPGIVHGASGSGASLFLEPLSTVEINNDIVALQELETREVQRILLALTEAFRARPAELQRTFDTAAVLDVLQARARFSRMVDGVAPVLAPEGGLGLPAARHPLLIPAVQARLAEGDGERRARESGPVPVDLRIAPPTSVLVITGPNTGGKTVALKTAGLLALMAQSGLHVPAAEGARLPVFRCVFADIGDKQSIEANLSTFSWHVTNIAGMDRALQTPALVLLDEVGAGTDPLEGGALAMAVIERFKERGATVIATTHYDSLKSYASTTPGVVCAAFGFTPDGFEPTYRLAYGSPGRSLALEIAARLGLPEQVIATARRFQSDREAQLAAHLARMDAELHALEHDRRLLARERTQLAEQDARFRQRDEALRRKEEQVRQRIDARVEEHLRDARREIDAVVEDVKRRAAVLVSQAARRTTAAHAPISTGETGAVRAEARAALDGIAERVRTEVTPGEAPPAPTAPAQPAIRPAPGDRVAVGPLGLEGTVAAVYDREAEVNVRGKRLRAAFDDLRPLGAPAGGGRTGPARAAALQGSVVVQVHAHESTATELNLIGCTVDEAVTRVDKFLDEAILGELRQVRLIHGHGTGQLRRGLAQFLADHPLVARFGPAPPDQGGAGATVVELKE
jgi:DNA mismatch repair protein MutS2